MSVRGAQYVGVVVLSLISRQGNLPRRNYIPQSAVVHVSGMVSGRRPSVDGFRSLVPSLDIEHGNRHNFHLAASAKRGVPGRERGWTEVTHSPYCSPPARSWVVKPPEGCSTQSANAPNSPAIPQLRPLQWRGVLGVSLALVQATATPTYLSGNNMCCHCPLL